MMITSDTRRPAAREFALVVAIVGLLYAALLSAIPVDDVQRYVDDLNANRFDWDLGHVWIEPLALILFRVLRGAVGANAVLEALNIASVALGCAIFHDLVRRLGHGPWRSALATALVALSFNLIVLGPTAHIKLMVLAPLAMSLRHAALWERGAAIGSLQTRDALLSGLWLGTATTLLVSVLPASFFVAPLMMLVARRAGSSLPAAFRQALAFAVGVTAAGLALLMAAYLTARVTGSTPATNLIEFTLGGIAAKRELHVGFASWKEVPFRFVFSLVNNFVFLPSLGALGRAWMWGMLPSVGPVLGSLAWQAAALLVSVLALTAIVGCALRQSRGLEGGLVLAIGFFAGAAFFSLYYNLNDPEHWFQFTMPIALLAVHAQRRWLDILVFAVWLPTMLGPNLGVYAIPKAAFALEARQNDVRRQLGPDGLYVGYAAYPGEPDVSLFELGTAERFLIDIELANKSKGNVDATLARLAERIDAAHARGARVLIFRALDPLDWRGPVMLVAAQGLGRDRLRAALERRYALVPAVAAGGFAAVEVRPRTGG